MRQAPNWVTALFLVYFAVSLASAAPAPIFKPEKQDPRKKALEALQGKWVRRSLTLPGNRQALRGSAETVVTVNGDCMVFSAADTWTLTLDVRGKPNRIDARGKAAPVAKMVFWGVYELKQDRLTLCWRPGVLGEAANPPSNFDPTQKGVWLQVFDRVKP